MTPSNSTAASLPTRRFATHVGFGFGFGFRSTRLLACVVVLHGLVSCQTTTLEFRSPKGSYLDLSKTWRNREQRVRFLSRVTFRQEHAALEKEGAPLTGSVRIDQAIDVERVPEGADAYFVRKDGGVYVLVRGYYWIYRHEKTTRHELTTHYVDISSVDIFNLLQGRPAIIVGTLGSDLIYRFELGIELPDESAAPRDPVSYDFVTDPPYERAEGDADERGGTER